MKVSVVVVAKNSEKTISECLESLINQDFPPNQYEVIVIDGASTDNTLGICRKYPVKLVKLERCGISYQRNMGIGIAQGEYMAFTDSDCIAGQDWLGKLVSHIESAHSTIVAIGGPNLVLETDGLFSKAVGYTQETFLGSGGSAHSYRFAKPSLVKSIPDCNIIYRKEVFASEKYDETLSVGDDCELNFRLKKKGYKFLYIPDILVWHHRPDTLRSFIKKMFSYGVALGRITRKHKNLVRWYAPLAALLVFLVVFSYFIIKYIPGAGYVYLALTLIYLLGLGISAIQVQQKIKSSAAFLTFILLPVQHLAYGSGFIKGFILSS